MTVYAKKYYQDHRIKIIEYAKNYQKTHKTEIAEYLKKYRKTIVGHLRFCFRHIKQRCNNPKDQRYKCYGGRGIELRFTSDEFVDYVVNVLKIDPRGLTVDRINNDGNYELNNIRFVTRAENNKNKRKKYKGK